MSSSRAESGAAVTKKAAKKTAKKAAARSVRKKPVAKKATTKKVVAGKKSIKSPLQAASDTANGVAGRGLMVLSPLRFPLDIDKIAIGTARAGGVFFVILGGIFTLLNASILFSGMPDVPLAAQVIDPPDDPPPDDPPDPPEDPNDDHGDGGGEYEDDFSYLEDFEQPFYIEPSDPIEGVAVEVAVSFPEPPISAYLYARNVETGEATELEVFSQSSQTERSVYFDSTVLNDGPHRFWVVAKYEDVTDDYYTIFIEDTDLQHVANEVPFADEEDETDENVEQETDEEADAETTADETDDIPNDFDPEPEPDVDFEDDATGVLDPDIRIITPGDQPLSGRIRLDVLVPDAESVEVFALPRHIGVQRYIGLPRQVNDHTWQLTFDSENTPNAEYRFIVKVRTLYGFFVEESDWVTIANPNSVNYDVADDPYVTDANSVTEVRPIIIEDVLHSDDASSDGAETIVEIPDDVDDDELAATSTEDDEVLEESFEFAFEHRDRLENVLQAIAVAERSDDAESQRRAQQFFDEAMDMITQISEADGVPPEEVVALEQKLDQEVKKIKKAVEKTNKIVKERTGVNANTDTDGDGITDFDEVVIYQTNPEVADSDGDGFVDGAEVLSGFDPTNSEPEVAVAYESPKETGIVREDILAVHTISTEKPIPDVVGSTTEQPEQPPVALLTGKGLPNSFVTLYIFSTPIVVTVKTDADGSWLYRFDKELEDGEHQVYVGITDNAGKIVAKSNPLFFVKEAQAFNETDPLAPGTAAAATPEPTDNSSYFLMLTVASISVVAIGLILILIGIFMDRRRETPTVAAEVS